MFSFHFPVSDAATMHYQKSAACCVAVARCYDDYMAAMHHNPQLQLVISQVCEILLQSTEQIFQSTTVHLL